MIADWCRVNKVYPIYRCRKSLKNKSIVCKIRSKVGKLREQLRNTAVDRPKFSWAGTTENKTQKQDK